MPGVTHSCRDKNRYIIKGLVLYQFKYYCVEATALSVLKNHYPLRQKGGDVGYFGVDSMVVYTFNVDSTDSGMFKYSLLKLLMVLSL